jgi:hypothetical protein
MLTPLTQFICDSCKELIEMPDDGWIEWESFSENGRQIDRNFRICHHSMRCQRLANHPNCSDLPLREVVGDNAYAFIYKHLDVGPYHSPKYQEPSIVDFRQYTDLMRRLTLPYFEEARQWWNEASVDGYFSGENEILIYRPDNLKRMIEHYSTG